MNYQEFSRQIGEKKFSRRYILLSNDTLLITNAIDLIKSAVNVNESFDYEVYSITDVAYEELVERLFVQPFVSLKRVIVIRNLEDLNKNELHNFAEKINDSPSSCCLIITYLLDKGMSRKKMEEIYQKIQQSFPFSQCVPIYWEQGIAHNMVISWLKEMKMSLSKEVIQYLIEAFADDLLGLKNELLKVKNYLHEAGQLPSKLTSDFVKSIGGFTKYTLANAFFEGKPDLLMRFEQLKPFLQSPAEVVDALTRVINSHAQKKNIALMKEKILDGLAQIDLRIKSGSYFGDTFLEIFFLKNKGLIKKR